MNVIDAEGFRANVGIILLNAKGEVFWARRAGKNAWQFPQGGMLSDETPLQSMYRELKEEIGLNQSDVDVLAQTDNWHHYRLPKQFIRQSSYPVCIGQKQKWFLLRLQSGDSSINLFHSDEPEFHDWEWVDYWYPLHEVIFFKQQVYHDVLHEFAKTIG